MKKPAQFLPKQASFLLSSVLAQLCDKKWNFLLLISNKNNFTTVMNALPMVHFNYMQLMMA